MFTLAISFLKLRKESVEIELVQCKFVHPPQYILLQFERKYMKVNIKYTLSFYQSFFLKKPNLNKNKPKWRKEIRKGGIKKQEEEKRELQILHLSAMYKNYPKHPLQDNCPV